MRVLLVEDDDFFAFVLQGAMRTATPKVDLARSATIAEATAQLKEHRFDAILLDLNLPDSSGVMTVDRIIEAAPGVPIVVLTADDADVGLAAVRHGAQDYLVKHETDGKYVSRALRYAVERAGIQAELSRRERHFRALIEQAYDIVVVVAPDGRLLYQSPAVQRVLGYSPEELAGGSVLERIHPGDREPAAHLLSSLAVPNPAETPLNFRIQHRDGSWLVFETLGRCIDEDPRNGIVINARDVTERVRAEEALRISEAKLRQSHKMEAVGRLAGGIAHDFNNVLTAIYGYADLLLEAFPEGDARRLDVEEIKRSAERAAALTRQLLAFSRQSMLQPQVLDLNAIVADVVKMLERIVGADVAVTFEPAPALWPVRTDPGQIAQVLLNLAGNARDAMPGGGSLTIRTENRAVSPEAASALPGLEPGNYVTMTVSDTGVGMSESVRRHVFEPFFTTKEPGSGTGLGLATVYGIVKQSGGGVYVESEENRGATFTIYLPPFTEGPKP